MATAADPRDSALERYGNGAVALHWIIAALIIVNLLLGLFHEDFARETRSSMMLIHKSTGITILVLSLVRLAWRLAHRPPAFDPVLKRWEASLARVTHWLFYALMILLPLSGWLLSSTGKNPIGWFGLFDVPKLPADRSTHELWEESHQILGYGMIALVVLHVAGALKHHFEGHRHLIGRMAPWARGR
ncbi:MAG: cytochrome b [Alphaproteobacteria bacterium]|nr:MAG: cytochrome b [Alphaproteobacteria bacterium]